MSTKIILAAIFLLPAPTLLNAMHYTGHSHHTLPAQQQHNALPVKLLACTATAQVTGCCAATIGTCTGNPFLFFCGMGTMFTAQMTAVLKTCNTQKHPHPRATRPEPQPLPPLMPPHSRPAVPSLRQCLSLPGSINSDQSIITQ